MTARDREPVESLPVSASSVAMSTGTGAGDGTGGTAGSDNPARSASSPASRVRLQCLLSCAVFAPPGRSCRLSPPSLLSPWCDAFHARRVSEFIAVPRWREYDSPVRKK